MQHHADSQLRCAAAAGGSRPEREARRRGQRARRATPLLAAALAAAALAAPTLAGCSCGRKRAAAPAPTVAAPAPASQRGGASPKATAAMGASASAPTRADQDRGTFRDHAVAAIRGRYDLAKLMREADVIDPPVDESKGVSTPQVHLARDVAADAITMATTCRAVRAKDASLCQGLAPLGAAAQRTCAEQVGLFGSGVREMLVEGRCGAEIATGNTLGADLSPAQRTEFCQAVASHAPDRCPAVQAKIRAVCRALARRNANECSWLKAANPVDEKSDREECRTIYQSFDALARGDAAALPKSMNRATALVASVLGSRVRCEEAALRRFAEAFDQDRPR